MSEIETVPVQGFRGSQEGPRKGKTRRAGTRPGKEGIGGARRSQGTGLGRQTHSHHSPNSAQLASVAAYTARCRLGALSGKPVNTLRAWGALYFGYGTGGSVSEAEQSDAMRHRETQRV